MSNYQVIDANGSVITIESSVFGSEHRQIVGASIIGAAPILGNVNDGAPRSSATAGIYTLGLRNDTLASVTAGDKQFAPPTIGSAGEMVTGNAPLSQWVQGIASCFTGVVQPVIAAQGASVFTYVTSGQVTNNSANNVYLTFTSGGTTVGYLPVPANSGALPIMPNAWKGLANGAISASVSGVASVFISLQGFISKT